MDLKHRMMVAGLGTALFSAVGAAADPAPAAQAPAPAPAQAQAPAQPVYQQAPAQAQAPAQPVYQQAPAQAQAPAQPVYQQAPAQAPAQPVYQQAPAQAPAQPVYQQPTAYQQAPAYQPVPPVTAPPPNTSPVQEDKYYAYTFLDNDTHLEVSLPVGSDIDFKLGEDVSSRLYWRITSYNPNVCRVKLEHDSDGIFPFRIDKAEIELKAVYPGRTDVVFSCGTKRVTVHFTAL